MDEKKFKMIDEEFECQVCHKWVNKLNYSARDHCPYCLASIHIDINPGDRKCDCHGILLPIDIEKASKGILKIIYQCNKCKMIKKNKVAIDDNYDEILKIMSNKK